MIDTNVLRGASSVTGSAPPGSTLRAVLTAILDICHRAVVSPALQREYRRHASGFGLRWLTSMHRKGKVVEVAAQETSRARRWMQNPGLKSQKQRHELEKDLHLVLAAIETDGLVVSCETRVRELLLRVMNADDQRLVGWAVVDEDTVGWLAQGAPHAEVSLADG